MKTYSTAQGASQRPISKSAEKRIFKSSWERVGHFKIPAVRHALWLIGKKAHSKDL